MRSLGLKSQAEWFDYSKSSKRPDDIPSNPWKTYSLDRHSRLARVQIRLVACPRKPISGKGGVAVQESAAKNTNRAIR